MFNLNDSKTFVIEKAIPKPKPMKNIYAYNNQSQYSSAMNEIKIDSILENEKEQNKTETWNKLDNTVKMEKLVSFAHRYATENCHMNNDVDSLIHFFNDCLQRKKLHKKKDLVYDKETYEIKSIPSLHFNSSNQKFTLKHSDTKRISTLKSLTPMRFSEKILDEPEQKSDP